MSMSMRLLAITVLWTACQASADTYDERLEFVMSTGTQWIDTGIPANPRKTGVIARCQIAECDKDYRYLSCYLFGACPGVAKTDTADSLYAFLYNRKITLRMNGADNSSSDIPSTAMTECLGFCIRHDSPTNTSVNGIMMRADVERNDIELPTILINNLNTPSGPAAVPEKGLLKLRWYQFTVYDLETGVVQGDFIPVKKGGVAGFFDTVTETFFPSLSGDPFVGSRTVTWTGGDTSAFTTDSFVVIPSGAAVTAGAAEITALNAVGGLRITDATSSLTFTGVATAMSLYTPLSGSGKLILSNNSKGVTLYADNTPFTGDIEVQSAYLASRFPTSLGVATKVTVESSSDPSLALYSLAGAPSRGVYSNEIHLVKGRLYTSGDMEFAGAFYHEGARDEKGADLLSFQLGSPVQVTGGYIFTPDTYAVYNSGYDGEFLLRGPVEKSLGRLVWVFNKQDAFIDCKVHTKPQATITANYLNANLVLPPERTVTCGIENVFDADAYAMLGWVNKRTSEVGYDSAARIDLGGFDQRLGTVCTYENSSTYDGATMFSPTAGFTSSSPAKLTLCGTCLCTSKTYPNYFSGALSGHVSFELNSTNSATAGAIVFTCPDQSTDGGLCCRRGTLTVKPTASFPNLTSLEATGEGVLSVETAALGGGADESVLCVALTNTVEGTVPLTIASGVTLVAKTAIAGKGKGRWLRAGLWGGPDSAAPNKRSCFGGTGMLLVKEFGSTSGLSVVVR